MAQKKNTNPNKDDNTLAQLKQMLMEAGIPANHFHDLLDRAIRLNWTPSEFMLQIYGSPQFKHMFPGIFRPDGSLKMTPYEYKQMTDQYQSVARTYGITNLSAAHVGKLIKGDVSMQEFQDRMEAIKRVQTYKPAMEEFMQILQARGVDTSALHSQKAQVEFFLGKSPSHFYDLWQDVTVGTAAREAGVNLNVAGVHSIAKQLPGQVDPTALQGHFSNLAQSIKKLMPLSQIGKYGLTQKDLVTLEFGGPNQAAIADRVNLILKNQDNFSNGQRAKTVMGEQPMQRAQSA